MNESMDRDLADWLHEGPESGPREGLERALAATRGVGQRPGWTLPERWLPMQLTMARTRSQRPIVVLVMLALLIVALVAASLYIGSQRRQSPAPFGPARNGAIVYTQDGDLFIADQEGGTPRALVAGPDADSNPVFSRQGDRIAFVRSGQDGTRVMTVKPDGSDVRELARDILAIHLDWSPDGSALIANGWSRLAEQTIVVRSDGSGFRILDPDPTFWVIRASWRPDGRHIAIEGEQVIGTTANPINAWSLHLADADGTNLRQLIGPGARLRSHEWSPEGKHLSFVSDGPGDIAQVSIADIDEDGAMTALRPLRLDPESRSPKWSPDGSQLAVLIKGSREQIAVVDPDGSGFRIVWPDVTHLGSSDEYFWSPDGRSLVITEVITEEDPDSGTIVRRAERTWMLDVATGEQTEVHPPVETWQRLAP